MDILGVSCRAGRFHVKLTGCSLFNKTLIFSWWTFCCGTPTWSELLIWQQIYLSQTFFLLILISNQRHKQFSATLSNVKRSGLGAWIHLHIASLQSWICSLCSSSRWSHCSTSPSGVPRTGLGPSLQVLHYQQNHDDSEQPPAGPPAFWRPADLDFFLLKTLVKCQQLHSDTGLCNWPCVLLINLFNLSNDEYIDYPVESFLIILIMEQLIPPINCLIIIILDLSFKCVAVTQMM